MSKLVCPKNSACLYKTIVLSLLILLALPVLPLNAEAIADSSRQNYYLSRIISLDEVELRLNRRTDLFCDFEGNLFLALTDDNKIVKLSPDGKLLAEIGGFGFGVRQFNLPMELSSRDGGLNLYLLDADNRRIVRLSNTLKWIGQIEIKTEETGKIMGDPAGLAVNSGAQIFISDPRNQRVVVYDRNGKYIRELIGKRRPFLPGKLAIDENDFLYICEYGGDDIIIFDDLGNLSDRFAPDSVKSLENIKTDRAYRYVLDQSSPKVAIFDKEFRLIAIISKYAKGAKENFSPVAVAPAPDGRLWIADYDQNLILSYDPVRK